MGFVEVSIYILNIFMILIGIYLAILYIKSKELHSFSFYNIIVMSMIILFDNIIRLIPFNKFPTFFHYLQAFLLVSFDKMILSILSMQIVVIYIIIMWVEIYINHEKLIFIIGFLVCTVISVVLTTIFIAIPRDVSYSGSYYYCESTHVKKVLDIAYNCILIIINICCISVVLAYFSKKKKAAEEGIIEDLGYKKQYIRFLLIFFTNILFILELFLIIYDYLPGNIDFIYLFSCLIIDIVYSFNSTVRRATKSIFCKKRFGLDQISQQLKKKNTFEDDVGEDDILEDED